MHTPARALHDRVTAAGHPDRGDRGSASLMVAVLALALLMMAGLVYDGSTKLQAARHVTASAGEAARAAAGRIDPATIATGDTAIDPAQAAGAARAYLAQAGVTGTVAVTGNTITVTTNQAWQPVFLGAVGVGPQTVSGHATARLDRVLNGARQ